jgi:hypothetical protein
MPEGLDTIFPSDSPQPADGAGQPNQSPDAAPQAQAGDAGEASSASAGQAAADASAPKGPRFSSVEDAEKALADLERRMSEAAEAQRRMEELLKAALAGRTPQAEPPAQSPPQAPREPTRDLIQLIQKASLDDEEVHDDSLVEALLSRLSDHPKFETLVQKLVSHPMAANAVRQAILEETERMEARQRLFSQLPELARLPQWALMNLVSDVERELLADPKVASMSPAEFREIGIRRIVEKARELFRLASDSKPKEPEPQNRTGSLRSGLFSEGGVPRREAPKATDALSIVFGNG